MRLKVLKEIDVEGYTLWAYLGYLPEYWYSEPFEFNGKEYHDIDEFQLDYPALVAGQPGYYGSKKTIVLKIDIDTGKIINWPKGVEFDFHDYKIVDSGYYMLLDDEFDPIVIVDGYVPACLGEGGYGDYLEFEVNDEGKIVDWSFTQEHLDEMVKSSNDN